MATFIKEELEKRLHSSRRNWKNGYIHHADWALGVAAIKTKKKQGRYAGEQPSAAEPQ